MQFISGAETVQSEKHTERYKGIMVREVVWQEHYS